LCDVQAAGPPPVLRWSIAANQSACGRRCAVIVLWLVLPVVLILAGIGVLWLVGERGHPLGLPSTRAALKGTPGVPERRIGLKAVHGYVYGRWVNEYIGFCINTLLPRMGPRLKTWWADRYHGKVLPTELAKSIITLNHDIA